MEYKDRSKSLDEKPQSNSDKLKAIEDLGKKRRKIQEELGTDIMKQQEKAKKLLDK